MNRQQKAFSPDAKGQGGAALGCGRAVAAAFGDGLDNARRRAG